MICEFGEALKQYDFICHLHTKKSLHAGGILAGWRDYLFRQLVGSETQVRRIFSRFVSNPGIGMLFPLAFHPVPYWVSTWVSNRSLAHEWCPRLGVSSIPEGYFDFPLGSMFWARAMAIRPILDAGMTWSDFPEETGQMEGTLAHCLERLFGVVTRGSGFQCEIIQDVKHPSWSSWRLDQYLGRSPELVRGLIAAGPVRVVAFDIFDTLLIRPVLHPETTRALVERLEMPNSGRDFQRLRAAAESQARSWNARDVGMDEIYEAFSLWGSLDPKAIARWREREERVERGLASARSDVVRLFEFAKRCGKRVVIVSDTFLPRALIEQMLMEHGIRGYDALYLSSEMGVRKDSGALYREVAFREGVELEEILMTGDNEHSDMQVPQQLNMPCCHVLRPVDMARGLPRFAPVLEDVAGKESLDDQLALGLVVKRFFHPVFYDHFDSSGFSCGGAEGIGYGVIGPTALAFVLWLIKEAKADGIGTLYFLAREGKILKDVYERVASNLDDAPEAKYLIVSRRSVTVPLIHGLEDICRIAEGAAYSFGVLQSFVRYRYGLHLSEPDLEDLNRRGLWPSGRIVQLEEEAGLPKALLEAFLPRIVERATVELPGLLAYLRRSGLPTAETSAVVDVGYSGTVQGALISLLGRKVHGYYLMTSEKVEVVCNRYEVFAKGCYGERLGKRARGMAALWRYSFLLEILLSSDEPQVECYEQSAAEELVTCCLPLSHAERASASTRADIQRGILGYVDDFLALKRSVVADLELSPRFAARLYQAFADGISLDEMECLSSLVLEDHYRGNGIVTSLEASRWGQS
jgi:FMN phosphatase YigB (HAD superfamily)